MPKLHHHDHLSTARFMTSSCFRRHRLLATAQVVTGFLETLQSLRLKYNIGWYAGKSDVPLVIDEIGGWGVR